MLRGENVHKHWDNEIVEYSRLEYSTRLEVMLSFCFEEQLKKRKEPEDLRDDEVNYYIVKQSLNC